MYQHTEASPHGSNAFAVNNSGDIRTVASGDDISLSLRQAAFQLNRDDEYLGVSVWGWAAPMSAGIPQYDDVPPSKHPERRRIHLVTIADGTGHSESRLHFIEQNTVKTTEGSMAVGALKDALEDAFRIAKGLE